jgi:hypothetical protein
MVSIDPDRRAFNGERACLGLYALTLEIFDAFHQGFDLRPRHAEGVGTKGVPHRYRARLRRVERKAG